MILMYDNIMIMNLTKKYSPTSIYRPNWSKMVVLIVRSTWIKVWIPIDLHVKGFNWSMTFPKKFQNFLKTWNRMSIATKPS